MKEGREERKWINSRRMWREKIRRRKSEEEDEEED